jgi:hypothetical protein
MDETVDPWICVGCAEVAADDDVIGCACPAGFLFRRSSPDAWKPRAWRGANGQAVDHILVNGKIAEVDIEIAPIVEALNEAGVATRASCSGHGVRPANIALADGREIIIARDHREARLIDAAVARAPQGHPQ